MDQILALRPFVPAKDFEQSKRFYQALGFRSTHADATVVGFKLGSFGFILQNFYIKALAENFMVQLMVRDVESWWRTLDTAKLATDFGVQEPRPPAVQSWGMKVAFIFDPSGVLWHVAEAPF